MVWLTKLSSSVEKFASNYSLVNSRYGVGPTLSPVEMSTPQVSRIHCAAASAAFFVE